MAKGKVIPPWEEEVQLWELLFIKREPISRVPSQYKFSSAGRLESVVNFDRDSWEDLSGRRITEDRARKSKKRFLELSYPEWTELTRPLRAVHPECSEYMELNRREFSMEGHHSFLASGLQSLRRPPLSIELPKLWEWSTGEPKGKRGVDDYSVSGLALPDTLEVKCLVEHLETEDQIPGWHRDSGQLLQRYRQLCYDFYGELISSVNHLSEEIDLPLGFKWATGSGAITPDGFVDSLYKTPGDMVSSDSGDNELLYVRDSYGDHIGLRQLTFGGLCIAIGSEAQLDRVEAAHRRLHSWLVGHELIQQIREVYLSYQELVNNLNQAVEVKVRQRLFLPGPCEICEPWGGLL